MNTENFSQREQDVIRLLLQGKSNKQIALMLGVSQHTVEYHLKNIYRKLHVSSRTEAVLRLGKSVGDNGLGELGKPVVETRSETSDNDSKFVFRRVPMKTLIYIVGGILLTTVLVVVIAITNSPVPESAVTATAPVEITPTIAIEKSAQTVMVPTFTAMPKVTATNDTATISAADVAHFVGENYPDGINVAKGTTFTKTWKLQNDGSTTWTTDYALVLTSYSAPLGNNLNESNEIKLSNPVNPGQVVEISSNFTVPNADGIYEVHYKLKNANGQFVSGDGAEVWLKITVGNVQLTGSSTQANNVTMTLINIQKNETVTNVEICAQLPDTQDWNLNGVILTAGNVQNSLSGYMLKNPKSPGTYSSAYRCYIVEFPVGVSNYGNSPVSVSISNIRVPAENNLEANCARAKQRLAPLYPGLDFTCGPIGSFYSNLKLPSGMSKDQADKIIMDALEQAIYGPWVLSE